MLNLLPPDREFENAIKGWVDELDKEEQERQIKAGQIEAEPDWLKRIDNPTPEDFVTMSNYLPFGRQLLERLLKTVEKIEKVTIDQFSRDKNATRFRDINAAIRKTMSNLKVKHEDAVEKSYGTRDVTEATHRLTQLRIERTSRPKDLAKEKSRILESLAAH